ncbi:unnamed protein product [Enterobius vermicularis]|uniref:FAD_binding_1 domain-containing protein n=1 Tax=Enterobius vermicularis TaxID=51028 RepID=A0A0N4V5E6_ENTVE|nr:unnamed protein product [Enterobius vermicularis]
MKIGDSLPVSSFDFLHRYHFEYEQEKAIATTTRNREKDFRQFTVRSNERVTAVDHFQDVVHENSPVFEIRFTYRPGDILWVHPHNLNESLDIAIEALAYSDTVLDKKIFIKPNDPSIQKPSPCLVKGKLPTTFLEPTTLRYCLTRYLDLQMVPRRSFFKKLAKLSSNLMEREKLEELGSPEGIDAYFDYCVRPRRTAAECLRDFGDTAKNLAPESLFDILPPIKPRAYSIASCPGKHPYIEILAAKLGCRDILA